MKNVLWQDEDLKMIQDYRQWPQMVLPMKRKNNSLTDGNLGVLLDSKAPWIIYHVYMFAMPKTKAEWEAARKTTYESAEAMLADGWMVD